MAMGQAKVISIGDLFRQSWELYIERLGVLTKITLLPVAFLVAGDIWALLFPNSWFDGLLIFIGILISFLSYQALIFALTGNEQFSGSYRLVLQRFWSYVWLTILSAFVFLGGFVMLFIPGIIFGVWLTLVFYVFAHGDKGMNALLRSREYVRGYWWQVFGRNVLLVLLMLIAVLVIIVSGSALTGNDEAGMNLIGDLLTLIIAPFITAYFYVLYQNLKSLKPEVASQPASGPRGFFYFSAVLGVLGPIVLLVLVVLAAAYFSSGGLGPDVLPNTLPR